MTHQYGGDDEECPYSSSAFGYFQIEVDDFSGL
ncbi:uncharacterized protein G2W53_008368 [Senna tora]|uniref:Uncharacterized protein n=1 Tax=Senna tora TaxID=362788 RepID=A0A834X7Q8_9FABA|nr:uncharacterized protein G2W53_008368 [Senna tora]